MPNLKIDIQGKKTVLYITDVEGDPTVFAAVLKQLQSFGVTIEKKSTKEEYLDIPDNIVLVEGGDPCDKGQASLRYTRLLGNTAKQPGADNKLVLLRSNRTDNKLCLKFIEHEHLLKMLAAEYLLEQYAHHKKLPLPASGGKRAEFIKTHAKSIPDLIPYLSWVDGPGTSFLEFARKSNKTCLHQIRKLLPNLQTAGQISFDGKKLNELTNKLSGIDVFSNDDAAKEKMVFEVEALKWMLKDTKGAAGAFEDMRHELARDKGQNLEDISDSEVLNAFKTAIRKDGAFYNYIKHSRVAAVMGKNLFTHGHFKGAEQLLAHLKNETTASTSTTAATAETQLALLTQAQQQMHDASMEYLNSNDAKPTEQAQAIIQAQEPSTSTWSFMSARPSHHQATSQADANARIDDGFSALHTGHQPATKGHFGPGCQVTIVPSPTGDDTTISHDRLLVETYNDSQNGRSLGREGGYFSYFIHGDDGKQIGHCQFVLDKSGKRKFIRALPVQQENDDVSFACHQDDQATFEAYMQQYFSDVKNISGKFNLTPYSLSLSWSEFIGSKGAKVGQACWYILLAFRNKVLIS